MSLPCSHIQIGDAPCYWNCLDLSKVLTIVLNVLWKKKMWKVKYVLFKPANQVSNTLTLRLSHDLLVGRLNLTDFDFYLSFYEVCGSFTFEFLGARLIEYKLAANQAWLHMDVLSGLRSYFRTDLLNRCDWIDVLCRHNVQCLHQHDIIERFGSDRHHVISFSEHGMSSWSTDLMLNMTYRAGATKGALKIKKSHCVSEKGVG